MRPMNEPPRRMTRAELASHGFRLCKVADCAHHVSSKGFPAKFGTCREHHPNRCLGRVAQSTFTLPSDHEEGRCRNLTGHDSGRCHLHRNRALDVVTAVEVKIAA